MKKETKQQIKKTAANGASTAAGAMAGAIFGAAITGNKANATDVETVTADVVQEPELDSRPTPHYQPAHYATTPASAPGTHQEPGSGTTPETGNTTNNTPDNPTPDPTISIPNNVTPSGLEVLHYERVTADDGSQCDVAIVNTGKNEVEYYDFDLDGKADCLFDDVNQNGSPDAGEVCDISADNIDMLQFQEAAGFNPEFAQNTLPDYINNADIDPYMA